MSNVNPWSRYWAASNLQSSFLSQNSDDETEIIHYWQHYADSLTSDARVLDLATGNGIVPKILLDHRPSLHVVGVDKAIIKPELFFDEKYSSSHYEFQDKIDICELPFSDESFDGVTSQFGIEYTNGLDAYSEISRILKNYGRFQLLMHHCESEPVRSSIVKTQEMTGLMQENGVLDSLKTFISNKTDYAQLENAGAIYLKSSANKTKQISGQLFSSIDRILGLFSTQQEVAVRLAEDLLERFQAQYARLMQMQNAAKNRDDMQKIIHHLESKGLKINNLAAFEVGKSEMRALIGWSLSGYK